MRQSIYLDHNATTPVLPGVADAMRDAELEFPGNAASQHDAGRRSRRRIEEARERVASLIGADLGAGDRVVFTSGGTESNNHALLGPLRDSASGRVLVSRVEHPSVLDPVDHLLARGWKADWLETDAEGRARVEEAGDLLAPDTRLAVLMLGNNETGVLQPVSELASACADLGVPVHCDAVQAVGKVAVDFRRLGAASMALTAHKFHGPKGIGALVLRAGHDAGTWLRGGFQPGGRPGTQSVALAVGLETALVAWDAERGARAAHLAAQRDLFERLVLEGAPCAVVVGAGAPRLPHTSCIAFVGLDRQALQMALDLEGIACSTGSACASGSGEPSHVLRAMELPEEQVLGALRFSLGATTSEAEIAEAARCISRCVNNLGRRQS